MPRNAVFSFSIIYSNMRSHYTMPVLFVCVFLPHNQIYIHIHTASFYKQLLLAAFTHSFC